MASGDWLDKATSPHLKFQKFTGLRLRRASLTRGNVGGSRTARDRMVETELAGWA
jgi:hypothetical protein